MTCAARSRTRQRLVNDGYLRRPRLSITEPRSGVVEKGAALPGAAEGLYYAAWLHKPGSSDDYVPLGSFHARQAATIRLWSGVSPREYPEFVVTLQRVGQLPTPSSLLVATARLN